MQVTEHDVDIETIIVKPVVDFYLESIKKFMQKNNGISPLIMFISGGAIYSAIMQGIAFTILENGGTPSEIRNIIDNSLNAAVQGSKFIMNKVNKEHHRKDMQ